MTIVSTLVGIYLTTDYDKYSLGEETLFITHWYIFLLMIPGLYQVYQFLQPHISLTRPMQMSFVITFIVISLAAQQLAKPSILMNYVHDEGVTIDASERIALAYIHDKIPQNSVILTDKYVDSYFPLVSSITGKAAFLEGTKENPVEKQSLRVYPSDNRKQVIKDLWTTSQSEQFCRLLMATPATHVIEYSSHPLLVNNPPCMQPIWESSNKNIPASSEKVTIWEINR